MNLQKLLLTKNNCYKTGKTINPEGIMVHSTGANNPNLKRYIAPDDGHLGNNPNNNHWNQPTPDGVSKCVHAFIGKLANGNIATYQTLPWNMRGWHAGGNANDNYIGFEICEASLTDSDYFEKVYNEAVELAVMLCKLYNIKPEKPYIICHCEGFQMGIASNHSDVMHWFPKHGKSMDTFRSDVAKGISGVATPEYPVLKKGDKGEFVKIMQTKLNEFGNKLNVDGSFGLITETALKNFQKKQGLKNDGICGPITWAALNKPQIHGKTPEEITVEKAINCGVITDKDYWLKVLNGKTAVSKENLKNLMDSYHKILA